MSMTDPISDMLTRIRNAQTARKPSVTLPSSKQKLAVAKVLQQEGYLSSVETEKVEGKEMKLASLALLLHPLLILAGTAVACYVWATTPDGFSFLWWLQRTVTSMLVHAVLIWPVHGRITSRFGYRYHPILHFGRMHEGVDIAAPYGSPIVATADGRVIRAGWAGGYGRRAVDASCH